MSQVINKTTLVLLNSVNTPDYPTADWIINPDLSGLSAVAKKYWKISGSDVVEMTQSEKDTVDADLDTAQWVIVRASRDLKLTACDWTQLADSPLTAQKITDWATYRQELRDIPSEQSDPFNIDWGTEPS